MKKNSPSWRISGMSAVLLATAVLPLTPANSAPALAETTTKTLTHEIPVAPSEGEKEPVLGAMQAAGSPAPGFNCEVSPMNATSTQRVWNSAAGVYQDGITSLTQKDVLVLGDSQVWDQSWVALGIRQTGYNPVLYRCGGIGMTAWRPNYSGSFYGGVVHNEWDLPVGKPRTIYIQGSGNDSLSEADQQETVRRVGPTVQKLRQLYPGVQIILTGPVSSDVSWQTHRFNLNEKLSQAARDNGLTFISYKKWVTDYDARWGLQDDVHFQDQYQHLLATPMANSFQAALNEKTLRGAIQTYVGDHGGSARFGVPLSNETPSVSGGVWQQFSKDATAYWSPYTGAHSVWWPGAIGHKYRSLDYERGIGYPIEDETTYSYGARQVFQQSNGAQTRIYWSPNTDAHTMNGRGAIFAKWVEAGHSSTLGFPVTDELSFNGGAVQTFRTSNGKETKIYWTPARGAWIAQ